MFNGSENAPGDYSLPFQRMGAAVNGMTNYDTTRYYDLVPTPGLEQALCLDSDRMGYLLGAVTQAKLDEQRAVVKNEKREGDNRPLAAVRTRINSALYPAFHPYAHSIVGSMADLDAADLDDVRSWFRDNYGPGNAILALAGDIDAETARGLAETYFGGIPARPVAPPPASPVPTLAGRVEEVMTDRVAATTLYRAWATPGQTDPDAAALQVVAGTLGGMKSSVLKDRLVQQERLFNNVSVSLQLSSQAGSFALEGAVRPGVDPVVAGQRLDEVLAEVLRAGPSEEDIERYLTGVVVARLAILDSPGGKANVLSEGVRLGRGADFYKQQLADFAAQTPASVRQASARWFSRPVYALTVVPGEVVTPDPDSPVVETPDAASDADAVAMASRVARGPMPVVGAYSDAVLPEVERTQLSNGVELVYLKGPAIPMSEVILDFDAGTVAEPLDQLGVQRLMLALLEKGSLHRDAAAIALESERLGARTDVMLEADRTSLRLAAPSANLGSALTLLADMIRTPAFDPAQLDVERGRRLAAIADSEAGIGGEGAKIFSRLVEAGTPYALREGGGSADAVSNLTRADLLAFHGAWYRPEKARFYVVSDRPIDEVKALLEARFGDWRGEGAAGVKDAVETVRPAAAQIVLVDSPGAVQSIIMVGQSTGLTGHDDLVAIELANKVLGGSFASRLNTELRERRGWSYGVDGRLDVKALSAPYIVYAPVQTDSVRRQHQWHRFEVVI